MENCTIRVHNLERELWADLPKGKLLVYYSEMAHIILPYIKDRPQSLNLKLTHAGGPRTFIKDMENRQPDCAAVFTDKRRIEKIGKRKQIDYLVCNNKETLIYMIDTGCVDINPWASQMQNPESPTYITFDLDPTIPEKLKGRKLQQTEQNGFEKAIEVALACKEVLDKHKLQAYVKTSGKTGIHIYVPCVGFKFKDARRIAGGILANEMHALTPKISTLNFDKNLRGNKVYIDTGQNDYADTLAAPYSIRPYHEPTVSTPLQWKEVKHGLDRFSFNINTIQKRLEEKGDLFRDVLSPAQARKNSAILKRL
jgi:bifunctional non-homologous end joining protein LigD